MTPLEKAQLQDAKYQLEARPEPGNVELMRHLVGHLDPQDALRWHLCNALQLTDQMCMTGLRPPGRQRLVETLQRIASILGRELPIARVSGDTETDREFRRQTRRMAAAFRRLKMEVLLPHPGSARRVMTQLVRAFYAEACDNWQEMPGLDTSDIESANGTAAGDDGDTSSCEGLAMNTSAGQCHVDPAIRPHRCQAGPPTGAAEP